jgi:hypothetical protein
MPIMVAKARPEPSPTALPMAPPALAPIKAPAPEEECTTAGVAVQVWRGTATGCMTALRESTWPTSCAVAQPGAQAAKPSRVDEMTSCFMADTQVVEGGLSVGSGWLKSGEPHVKLGNSHATQATGLFGIRQATGLV